MGTISEINFWDKMWTDPNIRSLEVWKKQILKLREGEDKGCVIECALEYRRQLYSERKGLTLAPKHFNKRLCTTSFYK